MTRAYKQRIKVNILITNDHKACLADFGLASVEDSQALALSSMSSGRTTGTSRWQAPELLDCQLADAERQGRNSLASDVYAFACVCYEACFELFLLIFTACF